MKLKSFFKNFYISKYYKSMISGRIYLKYNPRYINKIDLIRKKFFECKINIRHENFSNFIFQNKNYATLVLKNKLNNIIYADNNGITYNIYEQIFTTFAKKKYATKFFLPLCKEQIKVAKNDLNFNVSVLKCKYYFCIFILKNLFKGLFFGIYFFFRNLLDIKKNKNFYIKKQIIYFDLDLSTKDINSIINNNFFIIKKFFEKYRLDKRNFIIIVKPKVQKYNNNYYTRDGYTFKFKKDPYPNFSNFYKNLKFIFWVIISFIICLKDLFALKWYNSFLFFEAVKSKIFFYEKNFIPNFFVTPYMGSLKRSLWTFDHKDKIKRSFIFFYSTNAEGYETKYSKYNDASNWAELDFENYIVWDKFQKKILTNKLKIDNPKITIFGPILNTIRHSKLNVEDNGYILIFDIIPEKFRYEYYTSYSIINSKNLINFQNDIVDIANKLDLKIIHKLKRSRQYNKICKNYQKNLLDLNKFRNYQAVDDQFNSEDLINNSLCAISFPYVSAALIAKKMEKPSIYYDSSKELINLDERILSHGVKVINNKAKLCNWIESLI